MRAAFFADVQSTALRALNYAPEVESFRRSRNRKHLRLGDLLENLGCGYGKRLMRVDCSPDQGRMLLSQSDIFAAEPRGRSIRYEYPLGGDAPHSVKRFDILVAGAGTLGETELFGRCILADHRLVDLLADEHVFGLRFKDPGGDLNLYAAALLASRVGIRAVRSSAYGTKILSLRREFVADLPVPQGTTEQVKRVSTLVRTTVEQREAYAEHIRTARALLDRIPGFMDAREMCEHRRAQCVQWDGQLTTFTAWTYASAGEALSFLSKKWSGRLGDIIEPDGIFNGHRFARTTCEPPYGIDLLSQRDVFLIRPSPRRVAHPGFADRLVFTHPFTLLAGGAGTLGEGELFGRVEIAGPDWAELGISQHLLRILPRRENAALAFAFLSSMVGFRLLRSTAVGTKILSLRPDLLRALPFPDVPKDLAADCEFHVFAALTSRAAATAAEQEAIRIIEEEVLPAWLA